MTLWPNNLDFCFSRGISFQVLYLLVKILLTLAEFWTRYKHIQFPLVTDILWTWVQEDVTNKLCSPRFNLIWALRFKAWPALLFPLNCVKPRIKMFRISERKMHFPKNMVCLLPTFFLSVTNVFLPLQISDRFS